MDSHPKLHFCREHLELTSGYVEQGKRPDTQAHYASKGMLAGTIHGDER